MESEFYSSEIASQVLDKIHEKGWNVYDSSNIGEIGKDETIRKNLAEALERDKRYILLPIAKNPRDPEQVMGELEIIGQKLNREMPTITGSFGKYPLTGFKLLRDRVKIIIPQGVEVPYSVFMEALDTIVDTKTL